jgi:hypothetical protein
MATFLQLIPRLREAGVEFVIIGGVAAIAHGAERNTMDLDIVASMSLDNLQKLIAAIQGLRPKFRMRPDLPVVTPDNHNLRGIKNLYLTTDVGAIDILGAVEGIGDYAAVRARAITLDLGEGLGTCLVIDLDGLILAKQTANRTKDREALPELEVIRRRRQGGPPPPMPS